MRDVYPPLSRFMISSSGGLRACQQSPEGVKTTGSARLRMAVVGKRGFWGERPDRISPDPGGALRGHSHGVCTSVCLTRGLVAATGALSPSDLNARQFAGACRSSHRPGRVGQNGLGALVSRGTSFNYSAVGDSSVKSSGRRTVSFCPAHHFSSSRTTTSPFLSRSPRRLVVLHNPGCRTCRCRRVGSAWRRGTGASVPSR